MDISWETHEVMKEVSIIPKQAIIQPKDTKIGRTPRQARHCRVPTRNAEDQGWAGCTETGRPRPEKILEDTDWVSIEAKQVDNPARIRCSLCSDSELSELN